jgi:hypothetical protein
MENRQRRREQWRAEAKILWEQWSQDSFFILGVALYWGEGTKCRTAPRLALTNSDVGMLQVWLRWCRRFMPGVPLDYSLVIHDSCNLEDVKRFWKQQLGIEVRVVSVAVSASSKRTRHTLPYGTLKIRVGRGSVEWVTKMLVWLELARDLHSLESGFHPVGVIPLPLPPVPRIPPW